jgi:type I restriction enzyme M protein
MNLALRGIEADLGDRSADTFTQDLHSDLRADFIIANPPFNVSNWWDAKLTDDPRWKYGTPPEGNANFAWVEHFIYHLSPKGTAGFVLASGATSSKDGGEDLIRQRLVEADLVDCIVAMPNKLFYNSPGTHTTLWLVSKDRHGNGHRNREDEVLFIDARKLGQMESRRLRILTDVDVTKIANTYHAWRNVDGAYEDVPGFVKAASLDDIKKQGFVMTPGRYVGTEETETDDEPVGEKVTRLTNELQVEFKRGRELETELLQRLEGLR